MCGYEYFRTSRETITLSYYGKHFDHTVLKKKQFVHSFKKNKFKKCDAFLLSLKLHLLPYEY